MNSAEWQAQFDSYTSCDECGILGGHLSQCAKRQPGDRIWPPEPVVRGANQ